MLFTLLFILTRNAFNEYTLTAGSDEAHYR